MTALIRAALILCAAQAGDEAAAGWVRHPGRPVLGGKLGTCFDIAVLREGDLCRMCFSWRPKKSVALAESGDGVPGWQRHPANPVIRPGRDKWDHDACYKPYALFDGTKWPLWHNGRRRNVEQIGLATHEGEDLGFPSSQGKPGPAVLGTEALGKYVESFNRNDRELYPQHVPNAAAFGFLRDNVPLFECPDKEIEETYHFRWWTYRKHLKRTPDGFVITEFLPKVSWSGKHNAISCPAGHHFYEGRWLRDPRYLDDYSVYWFRKGGEPRRYSFWAADAVWARSLAAGEYGLAKELLPDLVRNWEAWEKDRLDPSGLFWQVDDRDGMEVSIGGSGLRATINSYQYGDAVAISKIAKLAGQEDLSKAYEEKAARLRRLVQEKLWDPEARFFKVLPRGEGKKLADVRELHGYTPWYVNLPDPDKAVAWKQLMDPQGFLAPYGPTTAEQRHPKFALSYKGHECQWNGPGWPYATSITLTALANLLNGPAQDAATRKDYLETLKIYAKSHRLKRDDGTVVPWIDENLNPQTGDWISRTRLKSWKNGTWDAGKGGEERGKDYNHSTFCDLVITGLAGLRPRADDAVEVNPLLPGGTWDWFCLDNVPYHGRTLAILWDRTGERYGRGKGLRVLADGKEIAGSESLGRVTGTLR
jgi:hypothetical protein